MGADVAALLQRRNGYATELGVMRATGTVDAARVVQLRAAKDQADAELDRLVGPEPAAMTLQELLAL
jgi:hypothetical protein